MNTLKRKLRQKLELKWRTRRLGHEHEARNAVREWLLI